MSFLRRINWITSGFLLATPSIALIWGVQRTVTVGIQWSEVALFLAFSAATAMSITAGYHRLFSHGTYDCRRFVKVFYLLFGAATFQQSVLVWASEHRRHHGKVDSDGDPYNIRRGFLWAHIGWLMVDSPEEDLSNVPDLVADPWIRLQHRFYIPLAFAVGFGLPLAIGFAIGNPWGVLLWAGVVRTVTCHHSTFLVNSLAHTLGGRPYNMAVSARDSLFTAFLTFGEGYHNFHHRFATDYRNGIRFYQWDPTKWLIRGMASLGWAWNLYRVPRERIVAARIECESARLAESLGAASGAGSMPEPWNEQLGHVSRLVVEKAAQLGSLERQRCGAYMWEWAKRPVGPRPTWMELRAARSEFRHAWRSWRAAVRQLRGSVLGPELRLAVR